MRNAPMCAHAQPIVKLKSGTIKKEKYKYKRERSKQEE